MAKGKEEQTPNNEEEKALEVIEKAIELAPKDAKNWQLKALILEKLKRNDKALEAIEKAIELDPNDAAKWLPKALILEELESDDKALEAIEKAIELDPNDAVKWQLKALILEKLERNNKALEAVEKAIELDPISALKRWLKAIILEKLERNDEALEAIEKAIELDANDAAKWQLKAEILHNLRRLDDALISIEKAIKLRPTAGDSYNIKGVILMGGTRNDEALSCFDIALQKRINHLYLFNKGTALIRLKRIDEAKDSMSRARDLVSLPKNKAEEKAQKDYDDVLKKLEGMGERVSWWDWWFRKASKPRCAFGIFLIAIVVVCLLAPFVRAGTFGWFNSGGGWDTYIVPAVISTLLLILPVITKFGPQGIEVMPMPKLHPSEIDISELVKTIKPKIE